MLWKRLCGIKAYKAVLVTHNETSTGVVNDLTGLGKLVAKTEALTYWWMQ
jgi:aspartate aminotransferase-like enzyme